VHSITRPACRCDVVVTPSRVEPAAPLGLRRAKRPGTFAVAWLAGAPAPPGSAPCPSASARPTDVTRTSSPGPWTAGLGGVYFGLGNGRNAGTEQCPAWQRDCVWGCPMPPKSKNRNSEASPACVGVALLMFSPNASKGLNTRYRNDFAENDPAILPPTATLCFVPTTWSPLLSP
jgi:hypothetical protein